MERVFISVHFYSTKSNTTICQATNSDVFQTNRNLNFMYSTGHMKIPVNHLYANKFSARPKKMELVVF